MTERLNWDQTRMAMAREIAKRSLCTRDQVGAVIVDTRNRIIGEGYNGPPADFQHNDEPCIEWCARAALKHWQENTDGTENLPQICMNRRERRQITETDYSDCPSLHAEANALMMSDRTARLGGTIYVTSFPCTGCLKLISNSGLRRIHVGVDGKHEYRYQETDYETVRRLGFAISFEDERRFSTWLSHARGFVAEDGMIWATDNARHWCAPSTTDD